MKAARKKPAPVDEDGYLRLTGEILWKWRAHEAELRAASAELDSVKRQVATEIGKHPELSALMGKQLELFGAMATAKAELSEVQSTIETTFGISLKECAFDDKTGRLYRLTATGDRGEPVKARKRSGG